MTQRSSLFHRTSFTENYSSSKLLSILTPSGLYGNDRYEPTAPWKEFGLGGSTS